jgi:hypothetical protein
MIVRYWVYVREIASIHNLRMRCRRLIQSGRQLAKYGPAREEKDRG